MYFNILNDNDAQKMYILIIFLIEYNTFPQFNK